MYHKNFSWQNKKQKGISNHSTGFSKKLKISDEVCIILENKTDEQYFNFSIENSTLCMHSKPNYTCI